MMKRWTPLLSMVLVLTMNVVLLACPMCKESIPATDAQQADAVPSGFNYSVYTLLLGVFTVMGMVGFVIVKGIRGSHVNLPAGRPSR